MAIAVPFVPDGVQRAGMQGQPKETVRFVEVVTADTHSRDGQTRVTRRIDVPLESLAELGWTEGRLVWVSIEVR